VRNISNNIAFGGGESASLIENLIPNKKYFVRAYAKMASSKVYYSDEISFNTLPEDILTLSTSEINFKKEGETKSFTIETNLKVTNISSDKNWCKVSYNANDPKNVTVTVDKNGTTSPRTATITVEANNPATDKKTSKTVLIKQEKGDDEDSEWVLINGVKWATRNIDKPGIFAAKPEDAGMLYQWNRSTTDYLDNYDNSIYASASSWLPANDPSPLGYRVPTSAEIESLLSTTYVTNEWTIRNGVTGLSFTDKASGKSIFLPSTYYSPYYYCQYWSSTYYGKYENFWYAAYALICDNADLYFGCLGLHNNARLPVRPVAK